MRFNPSQETSVFGNEVQRVVDSGAEEKRDRDRGGLNRTFCSTPNSHMAVKNERTAIIVLSRLVHKEYHSISGECTDRRLSQQKMLS